MNKYIAFLRAVNVGGRVVKMDELKKIFSLPGFKNISTYIQSGNVLFKTKETEVTVLKKKTENALKKALSYEVLVFLKTIPDIEKIIKRNPFKKEMEGMHLYVSMLSEEPARENIPLLEKYRAPEERITIDGINAYILCPPKTYGTSKLSNSMLEKKLKVSATTRNWATMNKIIEL
ncbi:MAG TPA: DUF1697 domain-containing protein [Bacteroidia bacterium]|nr:DUF1697 domain-containing protein [Bacteroidia bacterium]